jgi:nucleoside phosphorylase
MLDAANPIADVLIVTVTRIESRAVLQAFEQATGHAAKSITVDDRIYRDLGTINATKVFMAFSEMGAGGLGAAQQTVQKGIIALQPHAIIMVGIAFGVNEEKQAIGDILVAKQLMLYESQRVSVIETSSRGDRPHSAPRLVNFLQNAYLDWEGAEVRFGLVLTGEKLVDNLDYRESLKKLESEAIGGEMEGAGLYVSCHDAKVDWILVKAICDWADGNKSFDKEQRQQQAAANAVDFVLYALKQAPLPRLMPLHLRQTSEYQQPVRQIDATIYIEGDISNGQVAGRDIININQAVSKAETDWIQHPNASSLAYANLFGQWDNGNQEDIKIIQRLVKEDYGIWCNKIKEFLILPDKPISLTNGLWQVTYRKKLWQALGTRLLDDDLDRFKECAISVLTEPDPKFELPTNRRPVAAIYKKILPHSHNLRKGIAESMALLGSQPDILNHCSHGKPEAIAASTLRKIFSVADWLLWGSLNNLLPILAEAAPKEFS